MKTIYIKFWLHNWPLLGFASTMYRFSGRISSVLVTLKNRKESWLQFLEFPKMDSFALDSGLLWDLIHFLGGTEEEAKYVNPKMFQLSGPIYCI